MKTHKPAPVSTLATAYAGGARWAALGNGFSQTYATRPASIPAGATLYAIQPTGALILPPAAGETGHNERAAFLIGLSEPHAFSGMTYDNDSQSPRSRAYDYGRNVGEAIADLSDAQLPPEWRAFIVRACNSHDALVAALERARNHVVMSGTKCADAPEALAQISAALALAKL